MIEFVLFLSFLTAMQNEQSQNRSGMKTYSVLFQFIFQHHVCVVCSLKWNNASISFEVVEWTNRKAIVTYAEYFLASVFGIWRYRTDILPFVVVENNIKNPFEHALPLITDIFDCAFQFCPVPCIECCGFDRFVSFQWGKKTQSYKNTHIYIALAHF